MANDRVKVNYGKTINLGNFESLRIDVGVESDIKPGESKEKVVDKLISFCENKISELEAEAKR